MADPIKCRAALIEVGKAIEYILEDLPLKEYVNAELDL